MSNQINIEKTTFINSDGSAHYGYRIYDVYDTDFIDSFESVNDLPNDIEILKSAIHLFPQYFQHLDKLEKGVTINGIYHEYVDIKLHLEVLKEN